MREVWVGVLVQRSGSLELWKESPSGKGEEEGEAFAAGETRRWGFLESV